MRRESLRALTVLSSALTLLAFGGACADDPACDCDLAGVATLDDLDDYVKKGTTGDYDDVYVNEGQVNAVTMPMLADGAIIDAAVADDAAIAGSKVDPNFGANNIVTDGSVGIGTDQPDHALHISRSGALFLPDLGQLSTPTVLIENPDTTGSPDEEKFPGVAVVNYGKGHPYVLLAGADGDKDEPEAFEGPRSLAAWIGRAYNGDEFVEAARLSYVAEATFAPGSNPTTMRFELGDADPATPDKLTRMVITNNGNVGIGTPAPQATLDVKGYARLEPKSAAPVDCDAAHAGSIALTSEYSICACNGTQWIFTHNASACSW